MSSTPAGCADAAAGSSRKARGRPSRVTPVGECGAETTRLAQIRVEIRVGCNHKMTV